jgi:hypothetical protein
MRVLLISANTEEINMPTLPLGLACVAAATQRAGHEVAMADLMTENDPRSVLKEAIEGFRPNQGLISPYDDLLLPRFYLAKGLENWLPETLNNWMATRPRWMI